MGVGSAAADALALGLVLGAEAEADGKGGVATVGCSPEQATTQDNTAKAHMKRMAVVIPHNQPNPRADFAARGCSPLTHSPPSRHSDCDEQQHHSYPPQRTASLGFRWRCTIKSDHTRLRLFDQHGRVNELDIGQFRGTKRTIVVLELHMAPALVTHSHGNSVRQPGRSCSQPRLTQ